MGKNIQIKNIKDGSLTLRIGEEEFEVVEDRDFIENLSSLINGHYTAYESPNDTSAHRIKVKGREKCLYLTTWLVPDKIRDWEIVIMWEDLNNDFLVDNTFKYKTFRKEFLALTSSINKEYKREYLRKGV